VRVGVVVVVVVVVVDIYVLCRKTPHCSYCYSLVLILLGRQIIHSSIYLSSLIHFSLDLKINLDRRDNHVVALFTNISISENLLKMM